MRHGSQLDALRAGSGYAAADTDFRRPDASGVVFYRASLPAGLYSRPAADDVSIQLQLTSGARTHVDHGVRFDCTTRVDRLALAPNGVDLGYELTSRASFIGAVLPSRILRGANDDDADAAVDFGRLHGTSFADETIAALIRRLWQETDVQTPASRLLTDSIWNTVALLLRARSQHREETTAVPFAGSKGIGYGDWRMRRTLEHMEGRLAEDVGLDELATEVGLSRRQYTSAFRTAIGMSPHQWLVLRRVERASELLRNTDLAVTDIAYRCGFSSSQHLATVFKKHRLVSPTRFRTELR